MCTTHKRTGLYHNQLKSLRTYVLVEQDFQCIQCGTDLLGTIAQYDLHHIDGNPRNNQMYNLQVLCNDPCHKNITNGVDFNGR